MHLHNPNHSNKRQGRAAILAWAEGPGRPPLTGKRAKGPLYSSSHKPKAASESEAHTRKARLLSEGQGFSPAVKIRNKKTARPRKQTGASRKLRAPTERPWLARVKNRTKCCQAPKPFNPNKPKEIELAYYFPQITKIEIRGKLKPKSSQLKALERGFCL
jgi:hypothetical protein